MHYRVIGLVRSLQPDVIRTYRHPFTLHSLPILLAFTQFEAKVNTATHISNALNFIKRERIQIKMCHKFHSVWITSQQLDPRRTLKSEAPHREKNRSRDSSCRYDTRGQQKLTFPLPCVM